MDMLNSENIQKQIVQYYQDEIQQLQTLQSVNDLPKLKRTETIA